MQPVYPKHGEIKLGKLSFSEKELKDILISWLAISFAFSLVLSQGDLMTSFIISSLTVGIGFIAHELGHKIVAQKYGAWAEFRAFKQMLFFAIILAWLFGVIFAAPGAVMIAGRTIGRSRYGKIAAAGPIMSFAIAVVFLAMSFYFTSGILADIASYGFLINTWLGLFNMIPFAMFDGKKILAWNKVVYGLLVGFGVLMLFIQYI